MAIMRIGVQLPEVEREVPWPELRDIALAAEATGYDSIWVGDHLLFRDANTGVRGPWEAWSTLAGLAEATQRVDLGPLVAATSFHSPAMLAKKAATVDEISGGRLILGLGAGWNEAEYKAFGFPYGNRVSRFEEAFTIIHTLIRQGSIEFDGRYYAVEHSELLPRARRDIPLMIGSNGPRMLRIAVPHVDMWNTWYASYGNQPEGLRPLMARVDAACADVGRDAADLERTAAVLVQFPRGSGRVAGSSERPATVAVSADDIADHLFQIESQGISRVQLVLDPIDTQSVEDLARILGRS